MTNEQFMAQVEEMTADIQAFALTKATKILKSGIVAEELKYARPDEWPLAKAFMVALGKEIAHQYQATEGPARKWQRKVSAHMFGVM